MKWHLDYYRCTLLCRIMRGSFQETVSRKTAENTAKHCGGGVGSVVANHHGGGESSMVVTTLYHNKFCVAYLPRKYIQCYTEDGVGPTVTWAEIDWFELASLVRYTYGISPAVTWAESNVIWIVLWCQTVDLSIERSIVSPPHVRLLFLVIWVFLFLVWGSLMFLGWVLTLKLWTVWQTNYYVVYWYFMNIIFIFIYYWWSWDIIEIFKYHIS